MFDNSCEQRIWRRHFLFSDEYKHQNACLRIIDDKSVPYMEWSEHCVECGAPYCYGACSLFVERVDGRCRRFKSGIVGLSGRKFGYVCDKWGKLRGFYDPNATLGHREEAIQKIYGRIASIARAGDKFLGLMRLPRVCIKIFTRLWGGVLCRLLQKRNLDASSVFIWDCCADKDVSLTFQIYTLPENENIFTRQIQLKRGWNDISFPVPLQRKKALCLIFAPECDNYSIVTNRILVTSDSNVALDVKSSKEKSVHAEFVKCLAWDLDNTLWHGTLVNDGIENLVVNENAVAVIKELDSRGIVNTILSKNDYDEAKKALVHLGLLEYFVFPAINWGQKSENLKHTAKTMNLGLDAFAFIDDSPFERGDVSENLPVVRVFPETMIDRLLSLHEFNPPVSSESAKRRFSYQKEMLRNEARSGFAGTNEDFLRSCHIELQLSRLTDSLEVDFQRCYELIQRTNQLTLTGKRYSIGEFQKLLSDDNILSWSIRCSDKYGSYGIVGVVVAEIKPSAFVEIREFVMSCRVAEKGCEYSVIKAIAETLYSKLGSDLKIEANLVKTKRNGALIKAFDTLPFHKEERQPGIRYSLVSKDVDFKDSICSVIFL